MRKQTEERSRFEDRATAEVDRSVDPVVSGTVRDRLVRLAYRFLWNHDDAEEVAQDALTIAQAKAGGLRDRRKWWSWMFGKLVPPKQQIISFKLN